jgi:hypothetical protein
LWELAGTVGQPDAVTILAGGVYTIAGGYWDPSDPDCFNDTRAPLVMCSNDITVDPDEVFCDAEVEWLPATANDECDGAIDVVTYLIDLHDDGFVDVTQDTTTFTFPEGTHRVTATAADTKGQQGLCSFFVTVEACAVSDLDTFVRSDCDGNGVLNGLLDAIFALAYQFGSGEEPKCVEACDMDGDAVFNGLIDSLFILNCQFVPGNACPPAPYPECGADPELGTSLGCGPNACP